ncbi:hypothetical protein DRP07_00885 [Archaeoglobales archaeon]|nr:MAG: hypothetical protein DRP07_00885 [Archaeoglobales archaeon]
MLIEVKSNLKKWRKRMISELGEKPLEREKLRVLDLMWKLVLQANRVEKCVMVYGEVIKEVLEGLEQFHFLALSKWGMEAKGKNNYAKCVR